MVIDKDKYYNFLLLPDKITYTDTVGFEKLIKKYPYFQSALALYVKTLKNNNILHNKMLYRTAALTTDRSILFRFMEDIDSFARKEKEDMEIPLNLEEKHLADKTFKENETVEKVENKVEKFEITRKEEKSNEKVPEKMTYSQWLRYISQSGKQKNKKQDPIFELIDKFLKEKPKIVPKRNQTVSPPENVIKSVEEKQMLMTETLANLYIKQKKYDKAIQAFKILSLKYPKKSSYFANRINELKKHIKK